MAVHARAELAERLYRALKRNNNSEIGNVKAKVKSVENRFFEIIDRIKSLYEDKCTGKIPEDIALNFIREFQAEKNDLEKIAVVENKLNEKEDIA